MEDLSVLDKISAKFSIPEGWLSNMVSLLEMLVAALDAQLLVVHAARQVNTLPTLVLR